MNTTATVGYSAKEGVGGGEKQEWDLDRWSEREQPSKVWETASCWCQCSPSVKRVLKVEKKKPTQIFKLRIEMYCLRP